MTPPDLRALAERLRGSPPYDWLYEDEALALADLIEAADSLRLARVVVDAALRGKEEK